MTRARFNKRIELINNLGLQFTAIGSPHATIVIIHPDGWKKEFHPALFEDNDTFIKKVLRKWNQANVPKCECDPEYDFHDDSCPHLQEGAPEVFYKIPEKFLFAQYAKR